MSVSHSLDTQIQAENHFWQRGYFVDSVGMNEEIIRRYVRHQDRVGKEEEARQMLLGLEN